MRPRGNSDGLSQALFGTARGTSTTYGQVPSSDPGSLHVIPRRPTLFERLGHGLAELTLLQKGLLAAAVVTIVAGGAYAGTRPPRSSGVDYCSWSSYRLPVGVLPRAYQVTWKPDFAEPFNLQGRSVIDVEVTGGGPWSCLVLHAVEGISYSGISVDVSSSGGAVGGVRGEGEHYFTGPQPITKYTRQVENQQVILYLPSAVSVGARLRLDLNFSTPLGRTNTGVYLSSYTGDAGNTVYMVASQFEATFARSSFPCFDEPAMKANFTVTLDGIPPGYTPLSNMPEAPGAQVVNPDGTSRTTFLPTPPMSTYLLAMAIGPLLSVSTTTGSGNIPLKVYAVQKAGNADKIAYALQAGAAIITYYEQLFSIPFPLPKMDMIAIPDFAAGAMENWGLITYRETALLANTTTSSASELQRVAVVISHEAAHQWFGDIVSMNWWNALWLNEGFARRTEYVGVEELERLFPAQNYGIARQFQSGAVMGAMRADAYATVQQLTQEVTSSQAVESMFSSISYDKGGSLLWGLQAWLGLQEADGLVPANSYYGGITAYLSAHLYGNAEPNALWSAFASASRIPSLASWMRSYELQPGYPVITFAWQDASSGQSGQGVLTVQQTRYFASPYSVSKAQSLGTSGLQYWIPLTLTGPSAGTEGSPVQVAAQAALTGAGFTGPSWGSTVGTSSAPYSIATHGWLKANIDGRSYYRVSYPLNLWDALTQAVAAQLTANASATAPFTAFDRAQLMDDLFSFASSTLYRSSGITSVKALQTASTILPLEQTYEVWTPMLYHLGTINSYLITPDVPLAQAGNTGVSPYDSDPTARACAASFRLYGQAQIRGLVQTLGWAQAPGDTPLTIQLRSAVLSAASVYGDPGVIATARAYWAARATTPIPVNVAQVVLSTMVRWGSVDGGTEWAAVQALYNATTDASEQSRYLSALTQTQDRNLLASTLSFALSPAVRTGDKTRVLTGVAGNPMGRDLAWAYVKRPEVWSVINSLFGNGGFDLSNIVSSLGSPFGSQEYLQDIVSFWTANPIPAAITPWNQAQEAIGWHMAWRGDRADVCSWLTANFPPPPQ